MDIDDLLYDSLMYIYIFFFNARFRSIKITTTLRQNVGVLELSEIEEFDRIGCL